MYIIIIDLQTDMYYLIYNDDHPPNYTADFTHGHNKGVQVFDSTNGFWLIHSIPNFVWNVSYLYPSSGGYYGQSALCVTFDTQTSLKQIGTIIN